MSPYHLSSTACPLSFMFMTAFILNILNMESDITRRIFVCSGFDFRFPHLLPCSIRKWETIAFLPKIPPPLRSPSLPTANMFASTTSQKSSSHWQWVLPSKQCCLPLDVEWKRPTGNSPGSAITDGSKTDEVPVQGEAVCPSDLGPTNPSTGRGSHISRYPANRSAFSS